MSNFDIIKNDIEPYDNWFCGEVSGPIEHYFKKHNGRPVPKELVAKFLNKGSSVIPVADVNDPIHYTRKIANFEDPIEKAIYGFKDEAMAKEVMESIDNYEEFRIKVNSSLNETDYNENALENALNVVIQVVDMHEEFGFNEMLPHWHKALTDAKNYMEKHISKITDKNKHQQVKSSIDMANVSLDEMPLLQLHKFHFKK